MIPPLYVYSGGLLQRGSRSCEMWCRHLLALEGAIVETDRPEDFYQWILNRDFQCHVSH